MGDDDRYLHAPALRAPGYLANHASQIFHRVVDAALRPHGLSIRLLGPLLLIARLGGLRQRDLVRGLGVTQPALVATLDKLENAGLILRGSIASDRRAARIDLTPEGTAAARRGEAILWQSNAIAVGDMTQAEAETMIGLLQRMIVSLERHEANQEGEGVT